MSDLEERRNYNGLEVRTLMTPDSLWSSSSTTTTPLPQMACQYDKLESTGKSDTVV